MKDDVRVLKKATCPSLSGRSKLTYEFGYNDKSKTLLFRVSENTGDGHYNSSWIPLEAILALLETAQEPFSLSIFRSLYRGQSINNVGFLGAVLKKEGLIVCEKRQYIRKDTKAFLAKLNNLIKTPSKSPSRKTTKTAAKEAPK